MTRRIGVPLAMTLSLLLGACATAPAAPANSAGAFVIERDLLGQATARGEFRSITGARRGFTAALDGSWDGETFVLAEDFVFDDGERDRKTWRLRQLPNGEFSGTREDVIGAARGYRDGDVFRLEYDVMLGNGKGPKVRFRDVLANGAAGEVLNSARVSWHGLPVGAVQLTIRRGGA